MEEKQVEDICIYLKGEFLSWRDQYFFIENEWNRFGSGSGIFYEGTWHVLKDLQSQMEIFLLYCKQENIAVGELFPVVNKIRFSEAEDSFSNGLFFYHPDGNLYIVCGENIRIVTKVDLLPYSKTLPPISSLPTNNGDVPTSQGDGSIYTERDDNPQIGGGIENPDPVDPVDPEDPSAELKTISVSDRIIVMKCTESYILVKYSFIHDDIKLVKFNNQWEVIGTWTYTGSSSSTSRIIKGDFCEAEGRIYLAYIRDNYVYVKGLNLDITSNAIFMEDVSSRLLFESPKISTGSVFWDDHYNNGKKLSTRELLFVYITGISLGVPKQQLRAVMYSNLLNTMREIGMNENLNFDEQNGFMSPICYEKSGFYVLSGDKLSQYTLTSVRDSAVLEKQFMCSFNFTERYFAQDLSDNYNVWEYIGDNYKMLTS